MIGRNRPVLYRPMVAAQTCGAVPVSVCQDAVGEGIGFVLEHCGARIIVVGDQEQADKVHEVRGSFHTPELIVFHARRGLRKYGHGHLHDFATVQEDGRAVREALLPELVAGREAPGPEDTCVMLHANGTTGRPKGVVPSNRNIVETLGNPSESYRPGPGDEVLACRPKGRVDDFIFSIRPTCFFAPPRAFESQRASVMIRMGGGAHEVADVLEIHGSGQARGPGHAGRQAAGAG